MRIILGLLFALTGLSNMLAQNLTVYPLHIGDRWHYREFAGIGPPFRVRKVVGDTLMSNGLIYSTIHDSGFTFQVSYQRQSGNRVFQYGFVTPNADQLIYDFSRSVGDTIVTISRGNDTTDIILTWQGLGNVFGVNRRRWEFLIDNYRHFVDDEDYHLVTDSIGITEMIRYGPSYRLTGALINRVVYGTLSNVQQRSLNLPVEYQLIQNYPNPFNPSTTIEFSLPRSGYVRLQVFNILGEVVATLVNEELNVGTYRTQWNASDVASGIYFYQLHAGAFVDTKKLLLLK